MCGREMPILITCAVAFALAPGRLLADVPPGEPVSPEVAETALSYANALAAGDVETAWNLLSTQSRSQLTLPKWGEAFARRTTIPKPPANTILRALATAPTPPQIREVLTRTDEALIQVAGSVQITRQLVLVREAAGWRVDLAVSDLLNARQAAQIFLEAVRKDASASASRAPVAAPHVSLPLLRTLFAPEAKDYRIVAAEAEEDRAEVTVAADIPMNLVLRTVRVGPGWTVDLTRPLVSIDATTPDPIQQALAIADEEACREQLRQLGKAIQMYASSSDDMFPDPDRWLDQIRTYLPHPHKLHCPRDPTPGISYAMNPNLAGKRRREIGNQRANPLLFESALHTSNPAGTGESWADPPRHPDGNLVLFVDGSVRLLGSPPSFTVTKAAPGSARRRPPTRPPMRIAPPTSSR